MVRDEVILGVNVVHSWKTSDNYSLSLSGIVAASVHLFEAQSPWSTEEVRLHTVLAEFPLV